MCIVAWNWQPLSACPLHLMGNRDEFYARPTKSLHWWNEEILGGKDMQDGGTWMGVARGGKLAVLTNYRDPSQHRANVPSRGQLVADFLTKNHSLDIYLNHLSSVAHAYNPFNLLLFDGTNLKGFESRHARVIEIRPGLGGVSNGDFFAPWPKLRNLTNQFQLSLKNGITEDRHFLSLLQNDIRAKDADLPQTGVDIDRERELSACFIRTPAYGTRASSIVRIFDQTLFFTEQCFDSQGATTLTQQSFSL